MEHGTGSHPLSMVLDGVVSKLVARREALPAGATAFSGIDKSVESSPLVSQHPVEWLLEFQLMNRNFAFLECNVRITAQKLLAAVNLR
ncbi:MAG: hypothetical protein N0E41_02675 [Candidatus Thiodiazotropha taylori]|nr:hypothetical protein [Candidatus Thiodiazotropha taylori]